GDAIMATTLIRMKQEGFKPDRDIILALTADEELSDSPHDGAHWLIDHHRDLIDAGLAINEGGGGALRDGKPVRLSVHLAEKIYQSYRLEVKNPGGHSATPQRENAIYRLAQGLGRIAKFDFPVSLNPVTRAYFERIAATEQGDVAAAIKPLLAGSTDAAALAPLTERPTMNNQIRTTCVATMLQAGDARNALPKRATANINCRVFPGVSIASVQDQLAKAIADSNVKIKVRQPPPVESPASPLRPDVMRAIAATVHERYPGLDIVPAMSSGATDSMYFRNAGVPCYGVDPDFAIPGSAHAHGRNERLLATEVPAALNFWHRLLTRLTK
ncbi:MAG: M20/M25/M40 family metallo-hydrolase, partial [Rhodanobacteraceae bacterium]